MDDFTPDDRKIFEYHDGAQKVFGDPLDLHARLTLALVEPQKIVKRINDADAAGAEPNIVLDGWLASQQLIAAVREVFGLKPFDRATGQGATDAQALAVVRRFWEFLDQKKSVAA